MNPQYERELAIREGTRIGHEDEYFAARPQLDEKAHRSLFEAGFNRGYQAAQAQQPGINGLTYDEESQTASVMGLVGKQATTAQEPVGYVGPNVMVDRLAKGQDCYLYPFKFAGGVPLYTAEPQRKPLSSEDHYELMRGAGPELLELAKSWADNKIHVYQYVNEAEKIIKKVIEAAITKEQT